MAYGEVQGKTWRSPSIRGLSDSHKLAWNYFLSNKHSNMLGYYELPITYMAEDLEWVVGKAEKAIKNLESRGLIAYDHAAQIVFVCKYMRYNSLSRGARETGAITRLDDMVVSTLLVRLSAAINEWQPQLEELRASIEKRCPDLSLFSDRSESSRSPIGDIVIVTDREPVTDRDTELPNDGEDFEQFWNEFKAMKRGVGKVAAKKAWHTTTFVGRPGDGGHRPIEFAVLIEAAKHYRMFCEQEKTEPKFIKQPATFLGPDRHWEDFKDAPSGNGSGTVTNSCKRGSDYYENARKKKEE